MGGSSSQTIGYRYSAGVMAVIGNRVEKVLDINPDERGWIMTKQEKEMLDAGETNFIIEKRNIFGGDNQEGGWRGTLFVHVGKDDQLQNPYLKAQLGEDVSAYPNLSYLVFGGASMDFENGLLVQDLNKGFELVSMSGMMKDFMLWVKRTRVRNDGRVQWYERNPKGDIVCEIGEKIREDRPINPLFLFVCTGYSYLGSSEKSKVITNRPYNDFIGGVAGYFWYGSSYTQEEHWSGGYPSDFPYNSAKSKATFSLNSYGIVRVFGEIRIDAKNWSYSTIGDLVSGGVDVETNTDLGDSQFDIKYSFYFRVTPSKEFSIEFNGIGYKEEKTNARRIINVQPIGSFISKPITDAMSDTNGVDINPIHKAREIITDDTAMGKPESSVNDENFKAMADRIYNEGLGISWCIQEKSCKEALEELAHHIEGGFRINRQTGLYECILFRDDLLGLDGALSFNESNIKSIEFDLVNMDEQPSSVNISYYDRPLIKNSSFYLYENGLARTRGFDVTQNIEFPYFMNRRNAELVGNWKLKQLSTATWKGSFKTGVLDARKINKYDVVKLSWLSKNLSDLPVRVMNINLGDGIDNTVTVDFVEVIPYSSVSYTNTVVDPHVDDRLPPQPNISTAFEMPYFESVQRFGQTQVDAELANTPEIGYLMASSAKPQSNSLNAQLYTDGATGALSSIEKKSVIDYCPVLKLKNEIGYLDNLIDVESVEYPEGSGMVGFSGAIQGTWIKLNDEIMVFNSYDSENNRISVKRGALDTVPQKHTAGNIFFSDEFSGYDPTQYIQGETVRSQSLTTTPSAIQDIASAQIFETEFKARAIRPYPPANVKINGEYYPLEIDSDLIITWVDRNRTQQTGGEILGFFESGVSLENGVNYHLSLIEFDGDNNELRVQNIDLGISNTYTFGSNDMNQDTKSIQIILKSSRDGFNSYQLFNYSVNVTNFFSAPYNIQYTVREA